MSDSIKFWNRMAERYASKPVANEALYQKKLSISQTYLNKNMQVLEFGCGTGTTALIHAEHVKQYDASDISPKMIDISKTKLATHPADNLRFSCAALEALNLDAEQYDAVLGLSILHLVDEPAHTIQTVFDTLKPGGVFISSTACIKEAMPWFGAVAKLARLLRLLPQIHVFSQAELTQMLTRSGFAIDYQLDTDNKLDACFIVAKKTDSLRCTP